MLVPLLITFAFSYAGVSTVDGLLQVLRIHAQNWLGWDKFPWRVTRHIHTFIDDPPVNFHYLLLQMNITAFACHLILTAEFVNRKDVLAMLLRDRFEFVGVLRHLLIDGLQQLRAAGGKPYVLDCTGIEDGHEGVTAEEIERRRAAFLAMVRWVEHEFRRILDFASQTQDKGKSVAGHTVWTWTRGDELPAPKQLIVRMEQVEGRTLVLPHPDEAAEMVRAGKRIPKLEVTALRALTLVRMPEGDGEGKTDHGQQTTDDGTTEGGPQGDCSGAKVIGDFKGVRIGKRVVNLSGKHKARAFLRFLSSKLKPEGKSDFYVDEMRDAFNKEIPEDRKGRRWLSDRFREDLFKGMEKEFDLLFETLDKAAGHYRLKL